MTDSNPIVSNGTKPAVVQKSANNNNSIPSESHIEFVPPDKGLRGWIVLVSAFLCNGVIFGIINTYSVIYLKLQEQLNASGDTEASSKAALVGSLTIGATFFLSMVSGVLVDKIGLRQTTIIGGILCSGGMFLSSFFTTNVSVLYFTYGIMFGLGAALAYTPTLAILGHYFQKYLGVASGIVTAGSSVFTIALPEILRYFVEHHELAITFRLMAGLASFIIVCGFLYKPLRPPAPPPPKKESRSATHNLLRSFINFDNWKKKKYIIWALSIPVALFGYFVPYVHMSKFVKENFPDYHEQMNLPVMIIGISSCIGRLAFGAIADLPRVNRIVLQQIAFIMIGIMTLCLPITTSFILFCVFTFAMGLFDGCFISLLGPIAYDICGQHGATQAIGFLLGLCSIPLTVGPPIAGHLYDQLGSYTVPFILAGIPPLFGAACMCLIRFVKDEQQPTISPADNLTKNLNQNGWIDPENPTETIAFLPKEADRLVLGGMDDRKKIVLASAESLSDAIEDSSGNEKRNKA